MTVFLERERERERIPHHSFIHFNFFSSSRFISPVMRSERRQQPWRFWRRCVWPRQSTTPWWQPWQSPWCVWWDLCSCSSSASGGSSLMSVDFFPRSGAFIYLFIYFSYCVIFVFLFLFYSSFFRCLIFFFFSFHFVSFFLLLSFVLSFITINT